MILKKNTCSVNNFSWKTVTLIHRQFTLYRLTLFMGPNSNLSCSTNNVTLCQICHPWSVLNSEDRVFRITWFLAICSFLQPLSLSYRSSEIVWFLGLLSSELFALASFLCQAAKFSGVLECLNVGRKSNLIFGDYIVYKMRKWFSIFILETRKFVGQCAQYFKLNPICVSTSLSHRLIVVC